MCWYSDAIGCILLLILLLSISEKEGSVDPLILPQEDCLSSQVKKHAGKELHALDADFAVWVFFKMCTLLNFACSTEKKKYFKRLPGFVYKNSKLLSIT